MITITNGQMTLTVPNSAYKTIYASAGFSPFRGEDDVEIPADTFPIIKEETPGEDVSVEETEEYEDSDNTATAETVDLSEIPLSEMDFYQLQAYAEQLGLNYAGIRSKKELRALIRNNI